MNSKIINQAGYLNVYFGCMFAGKSRLLIMKLSKKQDLGLHVVYVTHNDDQRVTNGGNSRINTHWSCFNRADATFDCYQTNDLEGIYSHLSAYNVIGIDEFQFFDLKNVEVIRRLVDQGHKMVYCVGLDTNFKRQKFGSILELVPFADKVKKIRAKCKLCLEQHIPPNLPPQAAFIPAIFTAKFSGNFDVERESGAQDKYMPLCRYHYHEYSLSSLGTYV